ncbi:MAG: hypothetical protein KAF40_03330 [Flavihumibacter sp.]|nr:hypothetical protein [Flavihumibacter sp.]
MTSIERLKKKILAAKDDHDAITPEEKAAAREDFATKLATAIVEEIKEAKINYTGGLLVGSTAVTGVINHTVS